MKYGQVGDPHDVVYPDYQTWGLFGKKSLPAASTQKIQTQKVNQIISLLNPWVDFDGYILRYANEVPYYSFDAETTNIFLMRFERQDGRNNSLDGEHISVIYDIEQDMLLGLVRMQLGLDRGEDFISHQDALNKGMSFLKKFAADLVPTNTPIPDLVTLRRDQRMEFEPGLSVGNIELNWMDDHVENIISNSVEVHGMKIKMYIPSTDRWAWVIVDKNANIEAFEKNISWDFDKMHRKTPMWLHDKWLKAQGFELLTIA